MEFREDDKLYMVLSVLHIKYAGIIVGLLGVFGTATAFGFGIAFFPWHSYDTNFDIIAILGFLIFLISGTTVHAMVLFCIHCTRFRYILPCITYHSFLIAMNAITALIAIGELVSDQEPKVDEGDAAARAVLTVVPGLICMSVLVILVLARLRLYIRNKRRFIRNGLPPPVREVAAEGNIFSFQQRKNTPTVSPSDILEQQETPNSNGPSSTDNK